jgi:hypothetical protein
MFSMSQKPVIYGWKVIANPVLRSLHRVDVAIALSIIRLLEMDRACTSETSEKQCRKPKGIFDVNSRKPQWNQEAYVNDGLCSVSKMSPDSSVDIATANSGGAQFEFLPGHQNNTLNTPRPLPSKFFPMHYSSIVLPFDAIYSKSRFLQNVGNDHQITRRHMSDDSNLFTHLRESLKSHISGSFVRQERKFCAWTQRYNGPHCITVNVCCNFITKLGFHRLVGTLAGTYPK